MQEKINFIFKLLINKEFYSKYGINKRASYWKMGTSFITMFERLYENIKNVDISRPMISKSNPNNKTTQGKNATYQFVIDGKNITPCKVRGYVSCSAMHQYMRAIKSFGIGIIEEHYESFTDFVNHEGKIIIAHDIYYWLDPQNRIQLIKKAIIDGFFSNVEDTRNISYSIILEFLFARNFDFNILEQENTIFQWNKIKGKQNQKEKKFASLIYDIDEIKADIKKQGTTGTYKEITQCLLQHYKTCEKFITDIYNEYCQKSDDSNYINQELISMRLNAQNILSRIDSERSRFKDNIFKDRKDKGLITNKCDLYSDLVDMQGTTQGLTAKFNEAEAAHIYDVFQIKQEALRVSDNHEIIKYTSNPNNGLIMRHDYHKSLDRRQWTFDANGVMIVPNENQPYLFNNLGLKKIQIEPNVFNEEMKKFLNKR